jgi:hypothetical protein
LTADTVGKQNLMDSRRCAHVGDGTREQSVGGESGETRSVCRLPHQSVTGDQREGGVPCRDRDREVESGDDTDDTKRVPGLRQAVPGRSDGMILPKSWRDWPTARSVMSIISCTSPSASLRDLAHLGGFERRGLDPRTA